MPIRFPKANTWFQAQTDTDLAVYAQAIHDGLVASVAVFATPPVIVADIQALINSYVTALGLATGPGAGKANTANKEAKRLALINALRVDCQYVNMVITGLIATGTTYEAAMTLILNTGYQLSKDPVPAGPLPGPTIRDYGSFNKGQFYMLAYKVVNAKGYLVRVLDVTAGGPEYEISFPNTRMTITGLISGHVYTFKIASIGANPTRNFDSQVTDQVVI